MFIVYREYPCEQVAMLNVTLLNTGCPRIPIHETAIQLLHLLYKRFYMDDHIIVTGGDVAPDDDDDDLVCIQGNAEEEERRALQEMLLQGPYSTSQMCLSETLARLHPDLTMPMFSGTNVTHLTYTYFINTPACS